jgi:hypothetical protein
LSLAQALEGCIAPALRRQGFGEAEIVTDWPQIVGARLAAVSAPVRLVWPPTPPRVAPDTARPATLCVRVEGAFALEMQHLAPLVLERVNARLGWRCVARLQLLQGPAPRPRAAPASRTTRCAARWPGSAPASSRKIAESRAEKADAVRRAAGAPRTATERPKKKIAARRVAGGDSERGAPQARRKFNPARARLARRIGSYFGRFLQPRTAFLRKRASRLPSNYRSMRSSQR